MHQTGRHTFSLFHTRFHVKSVLHSKRAGSFHTQSNMKGAQLAVYVKGMEQEIPNHVTLDSQQ
jgi:hypothetical protein